MYLLKLNLQIHNFIGTKISYIFIDVGLKYSYNTTFQALVYSNLHQNMAKINEEKGNIKFRGERWGNYAITTSGGEGIEVAGVNEVENDSIDGTFAFLESIGNLILALLRRRQRSHNRIAP